MKTIIMKNEERRVKNLFGHLLLSALVVASLAGCRKDLCYNHDEHALKVQADVDPEWMQEWENPYTGGEMQFNWAAIWEEQGWPREYDEFRPEIADGIRSIVYTEGADPAVSNLENYGGLISMSEGVHALLFYNNDTEYIIFDNTDNSATATASTRTRTRGGYTAPQNHEDERTITPPDNLYASYVPAYLAEKSLVSDELPVTMFPRTFTYLIRYHITSGLQYVSQARGALAGMAERVYLNDGHTDATTATLLFDCKVDEKGCTAEVLCFGVPNFAYKTNEYTDDPEKMQFMLRLDVLLKNGKLLTFDRDISEAMRLQPRGGILVFNDIEISDEDGMEGAGGFDPDVDDWGDEIDIPLPID